MSRQDLGTIIAALHDSEINGEVSWFFDGVWRVKLGDEMNGFDAEATVRLAAHKRPPNGYAPTWSDAIPPANSRRGFRGLRMTLTLQPLLRWLPEDTFKPSNPIAEKDRLSFCQGHSARAADRSADAGFKAVLVMETRVFEAKLRPQIRLIIGAPDA